MAEVEEMTDPVRGWRSKGTQLVNNYHFGLMPSSIFAEFTKFTFDCPAPGQYWEIHIETLPFIPFPNFLDSMIGSCEVRSFAVLFPGIISRV